jgi:hypothetical protein
MGLEAADRVRRPLRLGERTNAEKMANGFDNHGRPTREQQEATVELQDLST